MLKRCFEGYWHWFRKMAVVGILIKWKEHASKLKIFSAQKRVRFYVVIYICSALSKTLLDF